jgi:hypothetical protein
MKVASPLRCLRILAIPAVRDLRLPFVRYIVRLVNILLSPS